MGGLEVIDANVTVALADLLAEARNRAVEQERVEIALDLLDGTDKALGLSAEPAWRSGNGRARSKAKSLTPVQRARLAAAVLRR